VSLIDHSTEFGGRVVEHLRDEVVVWMTTVTPGGAPLPSPVWFIWDGEETAVIYSLPGARVRNIEANPRVTLNFGGNGKGGDIVVLSGRAAVADELRPAYAWPEYVEKYSSGFERLGMTPEGFSAKYSVPIVVKLTGLRGH
jgi:PPOX class probable F420-dependent enzyme